MFHYKPADGYFGDPIPFYWEGIYHVFYLKAPLEPTRHGADSTSYAHISTRDFIHWSEHPLVISPDEGGPDAKSCWTGSIIEKDGKFFLFYTGHDGGHPTRPQSICLAMSDDLDYWSKCPQNPILLPDTSLYAITDWRDPFVFWYEEEESYLMSITTVTREGGFWKGGALVMARSKDLREWSLEEVYYNPGNHGYPECSDLFRMGRYWYLVCSIFDKTCYRIGDTPRGPWRTGLNDSFDGVLNYAAKTISDGSNRYVLGWIRTKAGNTDSGTWEWAGHLSFPRQVIQDKDGTLHAKLPDHFTKIRGGCVYDLGNMNEAPSSLNGQWLKSSAGYLTVDSPLYAELPLQCHYSAFDADIEFTPAPSTKAFGLVFHSDSSINHPGYELTVDLQHRLLIFRKHTKRFGSYACQDFLYEEGKPICLRIIVERGIVEATVNDRCTLSSRFYHFSEEPDIRFFVEEGGGTLTSAIVYGLAQAPEPQPAHTPLHSK